MIPPRMTERERTVSRALADPRQVRCAVETPPASPLQCVASSHDCRQLLTLRARRTSTPFLEAVPKPPQSQFNTLPAVGGTETHDSPIPARHSGWFSTLGK